MLLRTLAIALALGIAVPGSAVAQGTIYGISNGFGTAANNQIYQINPSSGIISNSIQVTLPGSTVLNSLALSARPSDGTLFSVLRISGDPVGNRRLVTINPTTGVSTSIGLLGDNFSSLAFRSSGVLYGTTGDGAATPETLFTIDTSTAATTLAFALGNGADGENIAFHANGLLYHSSGNTTALFESIDVDTQTVTPLGSAPAEIFAMGYSSDSNLLLGSDIGNNFFSINITTGARTTIGVINAASDNRGMAFVPIPEPLFLGPVALGSLLVLRRSRRSM